MPLSRSRISCCSVCYLRFLHSLRYKKPRFGKGIDIFGWSKSQLSLPSSKVNLKSVTSVHLCDNKYLTESLLNGLLLKLNNSRSVNKQSPDPTKLVILQFQTCSYLNFHLLLWQIFVNPSLPTGMQGQANISNLSIYLYSRNLSS